MILLKRACLNASVLLFSVLFTTQAFANKHAIVIGGGSIGLNSAYFLSQEGYQVTVIESGELAKGCSYGNAGMIVPSAGFPLAAPGLLSKGVRDFFKRGHKSPFDFSFRWDRNLFSWVYNFLSASNENRLKLTMPLLLDLGKQSANLYREMNQELGADALNSKGRLELFKTDETFKQGQSKATELRDHGVESKVMNIEEAKAIEPNIRSELSGAIYYPGDGNIAPYNFLQAMATYLAQKNVQFITQTAVLDFVIKNGTVIGVQTALGNYSADLVVLATGVDSPDLAKKLRLKLLVESGEGYSITFKRPMLGPQTALTLAEDHVSVSPMGETLRVGGYMGLRGRNSDFNEQAIQQILNDIKVYLPIDPDKEVILEKWKGRRPCTPDGLPIIGRHPQYDTVIIATGHGTIGMHLGPITGKLVAEIAADKKTSVDITLLRSDRF